MYPLPLFLIIVTLPLLLGGCGEKHEGANAKELEMRDGIAYLKGSDAPYTGKYSFFHDNGQKHEEGNFKDGKRDGLVVEWYENGNKECEQYYKDGKVDGLLVAWHETGQRMIEMKFKDGKANGLYVEWFKNGQKMIEKNYKDDKHEGLWEGWFENGQKKYAGNYKDDKLVVSSSKYWNSKGEPVDSREEAKSEK